MSESDAERWIREGRMPVPEPLPEGVGAIGKPPSHYDANGLQPFDVIDAFDLDFYDGNAVKYLLRWRRKGGIPDLYKARHYVDEAIARAEKRGTE